MKKIFESFKEINEKHVIAVLPKNLKVGQKYYVADDTIPAEILSVKKDKDGDYDVSVKFEDGTKDKFYVYKDEEVFFKDK